MTTTKKKRARDKTDSPFKFTIILSLKDKYKI